MFSRSFICWTCLVTSFTVVEQSYSQSPDAPSRSIVGVERAISGTIRDKNESPISAARVWWTMGDHVTEARTNKDGAFHLTSPPNWGLPEGPTWLGSVWVQADGHRISQTNVMGGDEATPTEHGIVITLQDAAITTFRIVDTEGNPVPNALVEPWQVGPRPFPQPFRNEFVGRTNADGIVQMPLVPKLDLIIRVTSDAYGTQERRFYASEPNERVITLRGCGRLEGQVLGTAQSRTGLKITIRTVDTKGQEQARDTGNSDALRTLTSGTAIVTLDAEGYFSIPALAAGNVQLEVESPPEALERPILPGMSSVAAGESTAIEMKMERGVVVSGRVLSEGTEQPLAGVKVAVTSGKPFLTVTATTDDQGRYRLAALPGRVFARIAERGPAHSWNFLPPLPNATAMTQVTAGGPEGQLQDLRLAAGRRIMGRLVDTQGRPVPQTRVVAEGPGSIGQTNHDGYFIMSIPAAAKISGFKAGNPIALQFATKTISESPLILKFAEPDGALLLFGGDPIK